MNQPTDNKSEDKAIDALMAAAFRFSGLVAACSFFRLYMWFFCSFFIFCLAIWVICAILYLVMDTLLFDSIHGCGLFWH